MAPQQHMDRLTGVDASFLHQEGQGTHMHIGAVTLFDGPPPGIDEFLAHIGGRLALVPRYRQKVVSPPVGLGRQRWIDDPNFRLDYHVRHTALAPPGDEAELRKLAGRIFSQRLDRTKPLWELWLVEGLHHGGFALINKTHHALVDGIAGVDLMTMLFDITPTPREVKRQHWLPRPEPTPLDLSAATLKGWAHAVARLPVATLNAVAHAGSAVDTARETVAGIADIASNALSPAPTTPLGVRPGSHRRLEFVPSRLEDYKAVKNAFGGTVNDVVLTTVAGALATFFERRGVPVDGLEVRACVPVSTRRGGEESAGGNRVTQVIVPLPIDVHDPLERLAAVRARMKGIKESKQALGAEAIVAAQDFAPPTILAQASRLNFATRLFNLLVTNVPGPQLELYLLGRPLREIYPVAFLAGDRALAIGVVSYNGGVYYGLLGDFDAMADLVVFAQALADSLDELVKLARKQVRAAKRATRRGTARRRTAAKPKR